MSTVQVATETTRGHVGGATAPFPIRHIRRVAIAVYFAAVTFAFGWPALLGRSSSAVPGVQSRLWPWKSGDSGSFTAFPQRDGAVSSYPWSVSYDRAIARAEFPFWDWHSFSTGYDVFSDGVSGAAYPIHWILWAAFDPATAHDVYMLLHLWLGGMVMYQIGRAHV